MPSISLDPIPSATFYETIELQELKSNDRKKRIFKSVGPIFVPIDGVYGGHLLAQSVWAATKTVDKGFYCNSVNGNFMIYGKPKLPFIFTVESVRQGKSYCIRLVKVRQPNGVDKDDGSEDNMVFMATVSFKTVEPKGLESQIPPLKEIKEWLKDPESHEISPAVDVPVWIDFTKKKRIAPLFMGVEIRKINMDEDNKSRPIHEHRKVQIYRPVGLFPQEDLLGLSISAHVYASDRNGLFAITGPHNLSNQIIQTGSLTHSLIFHSNPQKLLFSNNSKDSHYCILEQFSDSASEGRGLIRSRIWHPDGTLLASLIQDAVVRVRLDDGNGGEGKRKTTFEERLKSML